MNKKEINVFVWFIILSFIWGSSFILIKRGLHAYSPLQTAVIRMVCILPILLFFIAKSIRKITFKKLPLIALCGMLSTFFPSLLFGFGQKHIASGLAGILNATVPMFTAIIGWSLFSKKLSKKMFLGISLGLICVLVLIINKFENTLNVNFYALFILFATICYGLNINLVSNYFGKFNPFDITIVALFFSSLVSLIILIPNFAEYALATKQNYSSLFALFLLGIFGTAVAQYLQNQIIVATNAVFASSITYFIPIIAIVWGFLDGESITSVTLVSCCGILTSVFIMKRS